MRSARLVSYVVASLVAMAVLARARPASAQPVFGSGNGSGGAGLGVGAAFFVSGMPGVVAAYDVPRFHVEGLIGFDSRDANLPGAPTRNEFTFGVRGWYHLHQGANSDFSLGVGFGFDHVGFSNNSAVGGTETFVEPGAEARVFLTPNFSLFAMIGLALAFGDNVRQNTGVGLGPMMQSGLTAINPTTTPNMGFGFTYFFR